MGFKFYRIGDCVDFHCEDYPVPNEAVEITEAEYNAHRKQDTTHRIKQFVFDCPQEYTLPPLDDIDEIEWYRNHELQEIRNALYNEIRELTAALELVNHKLENAEELDDLLDTLTLYLEDTEE